MIQFNTPEWFFLIPLLLAAGWKYRRLRLASPLRLLLQACLLLALTNQILSACGKPVLPIESTTVEQLVTAGITTVAALIAWWKNNSFTTAALEADKTYDRLKSQIGK